MTEMMRSMQMQQRMQYEQNAAMALVSKHPSKFDGKDILEYESWAHSYDTLVEKPFSSPQDRLFYLGQYTDGDAKQSIKSYLVEATESAYREARRVLKERYGDPFRAAMERKNRLLAWPKVASYDAVAMRKFADFVNQSFNAMSTNSYLTTLDAPDFNTQIIRKLPPKVEEKWSRVAHDFRLRNLVFPPFEVFTTFVLKVANEATDPVVGWRKPEY